MRIITCDKINIKLLGTIDSVKQNIYNKPLRQNAQLLNKKKIYKKLKPSK